jgi:acyl-CoA thioester hydrolase
MEREVSTTVKVRFNDCDPLGHLNNVKYLDYMFNAREDHVEKTGCTWIAVQNEIAYLREVRYNTQVLISSKTIDVGERTAKVEILMKSVDEKTIHAVLWVTVIYFNVKTRRSETHPQDIIETFGKFYVDLDQKDFQSRVKFLRVQNAKNS